MRFFLGLQQILYSLIGRKKEDKTKTLSKDDYLDVFTKVLGILLVLAQIVKAILEMEQAMRRLYENEDIVISWNSEMCQHTAECVKGSPKTF